MKILMFIVIFLLIGAFFIISENKLVMSKEENRKIFCEKYFLWLDRIFENTKGLTSYVVKMDWLPNE